MSKIYKNSKDVLVDRILEERTKFIEEFGSDPKVVLLSRENFLALRNWSIEHPEAEMMQTPSMIAGMWIILDPKVDIHVGGL